MLQDTGIVVIARNEGERLKRCLASCLSQAKRVVFADSGSTDGSAEHARAIGVEVVVIERPYNQARGRNAGLRRLLELEPELKYVFFVDGDCELVDGFLVAARAALEADATVGAVCGRRVELYPDASVYNKLVHMEWNTPLGEGDFGGDVLLRIPAILPLRGYREEMVAGEDNEFSYRVRRSGQRVLRIEHDMTRHDVALHRFGAWWKRHARGGYCFAHSAILNWGPPDWFQLRTCTNVLFYGAFVPISALALAPLTLGTSLGAWLAISAWSFLRARSARIRMVGDSPADASLYAFFITFGKLAEAQGILQCVWKYCRGIRFEYIEYKDYQNSTK